MKLLAALSTKRVRRWSDALTDSAIRNGSTIGHASAADYALIILLAAILGSNFMMTSVTVAYLPPMLVVTIRLAIATVCLLAVALVAGKAFPRGTIWFPIALSAFFGHTLPFALLAWGQQMVDAGVAAIMMATMPLFTLFLAQVFTDDEKPNRNAVAGFALALGGIVILFGTDKLFSLADQSVRQYAVACAALCYGINAIITKQLTGLPWQSMSASFMGLALLFSLPLLLLDDLSAVSGPIHAWTALAYT
ncbi:MAG: DMT family transporter, partial [Rhizobiaceae bacterium]